jgi:hypothetical protein
LTALKRDRFLPATVLGPVLFFALRRLAAILADVVMESPVSCGEGYWK